MPPTWPNVEMDGTEARVKEYMGVCVGEAPMGFDWERAQILNMSAQKEHKIDNKRKTNTQQRNRHFIKNMAKATQKQN